MHIFNYIYIRKRITLLIFCLFTLLGGTESSAQVMDSRRQVDTLTLAERISLRTNMIDWTLMIPNIGVEFDLGSTNWSRYAINLNLRGRFNTSNTYDSKVTFAVQEAKVEGRMYWRERQAEPHGVLKRHTNIFDKLMSCRRMHPHHPKTTYYRGVYLSYLNFDLRIPNVMTYGKRGTILNGGITWGFVRPLYGFSNGNSLDIECGLSVGAGVGKWDSYMYNEETSKNEYLRSTNWMFIMKPIVNDLHVGFVYRFGKYPIQKKYRWRYDVDLDYRARKDVKFSDDDVVSWQRHQNDSLYKVAMQEFRHLYDSITAVHAKEMQENINVQAEEYKVTLEEEGGVVKEKTRAQKKREKAKKAQNAAARKSEDDARKEDE